LPTFTSTVADLVAAGPGLQISVGPSRELINALTPLGARIPSPHLVAALIDTGAHSTVLNPDVISRLGIKPVGVAAIVTPSTTAALTCNRFHINVYFSEDFVVENVFAIEAPMGGVPYQCLIGRDILRLATLIYTGPRNEFTIEF
jgi:predicted aspartyl protease